MAFACIYYRNRGSPLAAASTALGRQLSADDFSFVSSKFCTRPCCLGIFSRSKGTKCQFFISTPFIHECQWLRHFDCAL